MRSGVQNSALQPSQTLDPYLCGDTDDRRRMSHVPSDLPEPPLNTPPGEMLNSIKTAIQDDLRPPVILAPRRDWMMESDERAWGTWAALVELVFGSAVVLNRCGQSSEKRIETSPTGFWLPCLSTFRNVVKTGPSGYVSKECAHDLATAIDECLVVYPTESNPWVGGVIARA